MTTTQTTSKNHPNWVLVTVYSDTASGTRTNQRPGYQQLLKDCTSKKVGLILVKSLSQFGRDALKTIRHRMRSGKTMLNHTQFLGYTKGPDGILQIAPEEAEIVRKIFDLYIHGNGVRKIKRYLEEHGIKTVTGKSEWSPCLHPLNFGDVLYFSLICDMIFNKSRNEAERGIKR